MCAFAQLGEKMIIETIIVKLTQFRSHSPRPYTEDEKKQLAMQLAEVLGVNVEIISAEIKEV
jgi:hypothetical protein